MLMSVYTWILHGQEVIRIGNDQDEKSFKFLGLYLDETLSWKFHIQNACSKISRANYTINNFYAITVQLIITDDM